MVRRNAHCPVCHSQLVDASLKGSVHNGLEGQLNHMGNMVNRGGKDGVRSQVVLVIGITCGIDLCFLCSIDGSCSRFVGTVSDYIRTAVNHGLGSLLAKGCIGKGTGPCGLYLDVRVYLLCPVLKSVHNLHKGGTLNRPYKAHLAALGHAGGQHSHDVSAFLTF